MDRNLGAARVATSSTDSLAYGDLYQWGRGTDGHEKRDSATTTILSTTDTPDHGDFITPTSSPWDWLSPQDNSLWQGVGGVNNPCPAGFRLPTEAEWQNERASWSTDDAAGAYGSSLKLAVAEYRYPGNGLIGGVDTVGYYWSSTTQSTSSRALLFYNDTVETGSNGRAYGFSVRCIQDDTTNLSRPYFNDV